VECPRQRLCTPVQDYKLEQVSGRERVVVLRTVVLLTLVDLAQHRAGEAAQRDLAGQIHIVLLWRQ
jgi:hypothetical protein